MDLTTITVAQFKARFYRDFTFANQNPTQGIPLPPEDPDIVQDLDIQNAFLDAQGLINQALFNTGNCNNNTGTNPSLVQGYLYLTAHCLVVNLEGAAGGGTAFPIASKSAGSVSESFNIPEAYMADPILAQYTSTPYGLKYLAMVLPLLRGNFGVVWGGALP